jgi:hypothetical protein
MEWKDNRNLPFVTSKIVGSERVSEAKSSCFANSKFHQKNYHSTEPYLLSLFIIV